MHHTADLPHEEAYACIQEIEVILGHALPISQVRNLNTLLHPDVVGLQLDPRTEVGPESQ